MSTVNNKERNRFLNVGEKVLDQKISNVADEMKNNSNTVSSKKDVTPSSTTSSNKKISTKKPTGNKKSKRDEIIGGLIGGPIILYGIYKLINYFFGETWAISIVLILIGLIIIGMFVED